MKGIQQSLLGFLSLGFPDIGYSVQVEKNPLISFDNQMKKLKASQAGFLAIWAILNFIGGGMFFLLASGQSFWLHFHAMNASWGFINLGVAIFIYFHHNEIFHKPQNLLQQMDHQRHVEKMMMFNLGLDFAFMAIGWGLSQYANRPELPIPELWKGFGVSVLIQGAFLGILDGVFHYLHVKNRNRVYPEWKKKLFTP